MEAGFGPPEAMTLALLVTYKGRILGERYAAGHRHPHPARELVDGEEPHRHPDGAS